MRAVLALLALAAIGIGASVTIALTQAGDGRGYLSVTCVLLTLLATAALVGNLGRTREPLQGTDDKKSEDSET